MLCVLVLGALPQKGEKPIGFLVTISDLTEKKRRREKNRRIEKKKYQEE